MQRMAWVRYLFRAAFLDVQFRQQSWAGMSESAGACRGN